MSDIFDMMKTKLLERHESLKEALSKQIKTDAPKRKGLTKEDIKAWDNLGMQSRMKLIQEFGKDAYNNFWLEVYQSQFDKRRQ